jgi:Sec-independent protein translocase protein TatA
MDGWVIGFAVYALVVVIVVVLLLLMIRGAKRVHGKAVAILAALHAARDNTAGLWELADTNATVGRIVDAATDARVALEQRGGAR